VDKFAKEICIAISTVHAKYGDPKVVVRESPSRTVFASADYKKGDLVLVPATNKVKIVDISKAKCNDPTVLETLLTCGGDVPMGHAFHLSPMLGDSMVSPAWYIKGNEEAKESNLKVFVVHVSIKAQIGTATTAKTSSVSIPVFTNSKAVKKGDELFYFRAAKDGADKTKKRPFDVV